MEVIVASKLNWELASFTPYRFMCQFCAELPNHRANQLLQVRRVVCVYCVVYMFVCVELIGYHRHNRRGKSNVFLCLELIGYH